MITISLQEGGGEPPKGSLGWAIDNHFGSLEALVQKMNADGAGLQGSGWVVSFILVNQCFPWRNLQLAPGAFEGNIFFTFSF